jgi:adenylate kinase family enzyme
LNNAVARDEWILDGNFLGADDRRFERADLVVLLDLPRLTCIRQTLWRRIRDRGRIRPDLPELEKFDWELIKWIWNWRRKDLPRALERMATVGPETHVHHLRSRADVERFLREEC